MGLLSIKFVRIIQTFSVEELKAFETWLRSPWCNTNKNLIRLFEQIRKYAPEFNSPKFSKEQLFKKVLPEGKFSHRRMNNLFSEAYLAAERFLIFQNLHQNQDLQKDLLTIELQNRNLENWFFKTIDKEISRIQEMEIKQWEDHLDLFRLHRRIYHHPNANTRIQAGSPTIIRMDDQLDLLYLLEKAVIINEKIFRKQILKHEEHDIEKELKIWLLASENSNHPAIEMYKIRFSYSDEGRYAQYLELRQVFLKHFEELTEKHQKVHLFSLINDTFYFIKATLMDVTELLPLYQVGLTSGLLLTQGKLMYNNYCSIVIASNTKGTFPFTKEFIANYTSKLNDPIQADASNWAQAHTAYYMGALNDCLDILLEHQFKVYYFQRLSKVLTSQTYFDLFLQDDSYQFYLFNYFDSFEKWLLREKIHNRINIKPYLRFVQVSRALAKGFTAVDFKPNTIQDLLTKEKNIQAYNWLLRKSKEIIEKRIK